MSHYSLIPTGRGFQTGEAALDKNPLICYHQDQRLLSEVLCTRICAEAPATLIQLTGACLDAGKTTGLCSGFGPTCSVSLALTETETSVTSSLSDQ